MSVYDFTSFHEPKKLGEYFHYGTVRRSLKRQAEDLLAVQRTMEKMEQLPPPLAKMEAWRSLMRIEEDEDENEEEADWEPWKDDYINRLYQEG